VKIPYRNGQYHVGKGKCCVYLKIWYARWWIGEGDLSNGLGDCLPNRDLTLGEGEIKGVWCRRFLRGLLR
jgi:hypothetical protein